MKTTIELPDGLLAEAKRVARRQGTTVRALVEQGLRQTLAVHRRAKSFTLRDGSVDGEGLSPEVGSGDWETVRDLIYRGHGA
jgi:hypothetical protein